jgi:Tol biopolymer transport system component
LSLNPGTGVVSGTPTAAGNSTVTFTVTDSTGKTATGSVSFAIHPRTDRVSVNSSGTAGDGASSTPSISGDGNVVAFASLSANFAAPVGGTQIYVHNRQTNQIELISRDSNPTTVNGGDGVSSAPAISADGRFVAFVSQSANLVAGINGGQQVYLRDRQTGQTTVVSKSNSGATSNGLVNRSPAISGNGRFIAFVSDATNLGTSGTQQIYLHDTQVSGPFPNGQTLLMSKDNTNPTPLAGNGSSDTPSISTDGCFVTFASASTNLGAPANQIHVRGPLAVAGCAGTEQTTLVSKNDSGNPANVGLSSTFPSFPSISGNGRFIAFISDATNLVAGVSGTQIYLHDTQVSGPFPNGQTLLMSKDNTNPTPAQGNGDSGRPSISTDGCFVAFASTATNLGAPANQIHVRGPLAVAGCAGTEQTTLVSKDDSGTPANGGVWSTVNPTAGGNGQFIAFSSSATNLVTVPPTAPSDIYIRAMP